MKDIFIMFKGNKEQFKNLVYAMENSDNDLPELTTSSQRRMKELLKPTIVRSQVTINATATVMIDHYVGEDLSKRNVDIYLHGSEDNHLDKVDLGVDLANITIVGEPTEESEEDQYNNLPDHIKTIVDSWNEDYEGYSECDRIVKELEKVSWTCDYDLSGEIYNIRKM